MLKLLFYLHLYSQVDIYKIKFEFYLNLIISYIKINRENREKF
jgi:hypothetical protein